MKISGKGNRVTMTANGTRIGVNVSFGPWIEGVDPATIKVRPKSRTFPEAFRAALVVENNSDSREDYYEPDCVRLLPGHPLYAQAAACK